METYTTLDVTLIEPKLKHPTIFENFDALVEGEQFVIRNDHDPKPLYYQLLGERGNIFSWEYIESGPDIWKVRIKKTALNEKESIGEIVAGNYRKAEVFKKYGIDFCCGGKKSVREACAKKGLDPEKIERELEEVDQYVTGSGQNYNNWEIDFLVDYIVNTHHAYVREAMPVIIEYTQKVAKVHGDRHPEAIEVANIFLSVADELVNHMIKEENVLFPYIKQLVAVKKDERAFELPSVGKIKAPVKRMEQEHDIVGLMVQQISNLTNGYTPPADACTTYRVAYAKLKEFETDLHQHIHLENNILFPKAMALENELAG